MTSFANVGQFMGGWGHKYAKTNRYMSINVQGVTKLYGTQKALDNIV